MDYSFRWICSRCGKDQVEYVENGSPCAEVLCEYCGGPSSHRDMTEDEVDAWSAAIEKSRLHI